MSDELQNAPPMWMQDTDDREDGVWWLRFHNGDDMAMVSYVFGRFDWCVFSRWDSAEMDRGSDVNVDAAKRAAGRSAAVWWSE